MLRSDYIDSLYGSNGVPAYAIDSVVRHFYPNAKNTLNGGYMNNAFIYFQTSDSTGHAVNGYWHDNNTGYIYYKDNQTGNDGVIHRDSLIKSYYP